MITKGALGCYFSKNTKTTDILTSINFRFYTEKLSNAFLTSNATQCTHAFFACRIRFAIATERNWTCTAADNGTGQTCNYENTSSKLIHFTIKWPLHVFVTAAASYVQQQWMSACISAWRKKPLQAYRRQNKRHAENKWNEITQNSPWKWK